MALKDVLKDIEGYAEIVNEIEILKKYGSDYASSKGNVEKIISGLHPKKIYLKLSDIIEESTSTRTFRFTSKNGFLPPFQAGQYLNISVDIDGIRTSRPYSISSPPNQTGYYDITIRRVMDGFVSNYFLDELKVGDELESSSPHGNFHHNPIFHGNDLVFIAGGSGITPFISMIRETVDLNLSSRHIQLIYGCRSNTDIIFQNEISVMANKFCNFSYTLVVSDPSPDYIGKIGFITADLIQEVVENPSSKTFYLCGPEKMYSFCLKELEKLDIRRSKIRTEVYGPPRNITTEPGWPDEIGSEDVFSVSVKGKNNFKAKASESLMMSLEKSGINIPVLCRSGECSLCRTKLISGRVFHPEGVRIRKSDRKFGYIHPCNAYPITDIELLLQM